MLVLMVVVVEMAYKVSTSALALSLPPSVTPSANEFVSTGD